ncbi:MAG TPA: carboxypeptidase-like regulatory domain-containing protein [Bacteroidales bacterium]|nr:carboxypeptidase-like regulatory domain-containing protein [Bacteroidales bacterium]
MNNLPLPQTLVLFVCIAFLTLGCTKKETEKDFKGNLEVKIETLSEFFNDAGKEGFTVTLQGTEPEMTIISDTSGLCKFENVPLGNYILIGEKEGYRTEKMYNFTVLENASTKSATLYMNQRSTTKINNYSLSLREDTVNITGTISHNFREWAFAYPYTWPAAVVFISNKPDVSDLNYLFTSKILAKEDNNTMIDGDIRIGDLNLPSGTTLYVIMYGEHWEHIGSLLGTPSEIKSFIIP